MGAGSRTRTDTPVKEAAFETTASTISPSRLSFGLAPNKNARRETPTRVFALERSNSAARARATVVARASVVTRAGVVRTMGRSRTRTRAGASTLLLAAASGESSGDHECNDKHLLHWSSPLSL